MLRHVSYEKAETRSDLPSRESVIIIDIDPRLIDGETLDAANSAPSKSRCNLTQLSAQETGGKAEGEEIG